MERPFSGEEVKVAIWDLVGDKAPGLDGFPIAFYKECWDVIKGVLMRVCDICFVRISFIHGAIQPTSLLFQKRSEGDW